MGKIRFKETQKFRQKWIWFLIIGILGLFIWAMIQQLILGKPLGTNPTSDLGLVSVSIIPIGITLLFISAKLETIITDTRIEYRFFPFHLKKRVIKWSEIKSAEVREYYPIKEYGGWGIKYGKKGKAFNVSGKSGLELTLRGKKKTILFGTQTPGKLKKVIDQLIDKQIINLRE